MDRACTFQKRLNDWEIHRELVNLEAVETQNPTEVPSPNDLDRFLLSHYDPQAFESPCNTLDQLKSYHWSVSLTEMVEDNSPLAIYQSLDHRMAKLKHIKCQEPPERREQHDNGIMAVPPNDGWYCGDEKDSYVEAFVCESINS